MGVAFQVRHQVHRNHREVEEVPLEEVEQSLLEPAVAEPSEVQLEEVGQSLLEPAVAEPSEVPLEEAAAQN